MPNKTNKQLFYSVNESPRSIRDWAIYSLQWVVTMFYAIVWGYALVGVGLGFEGAALTSYMSAVILTIGISTLAQAWLGHKLAMVSGPNVIPSLAIVAAFSAGGIEYARQAFLAQAISGVLIVGLGIAGVVKYIRKVWSPLILGSMVLLVGFAIAGNGLEFLTESGFGRQFGIGIALSLAAILLALRGQGVWATLPPLIVTVAGYATFMALGDFNWELVQNAPALTLPTLLPYGLTLPPLELIAIMVVVNLMAMLNLFGNLEGYADVVGENLDDRRVNRSFSILGAVETIIPGILGAPATVAYGENLGIVALTRVAARAFILVASVIFVVLAFSGWMGGLMAAMPRPVAGAILLGIASSVIGIGANIMHQGPAFGRREQTIVGFSAFLSYGLFLLPPEAWENVPRIVMTIFGNPIISVILFVMLLERVVFPHEKAESGAAQVEKEKTAA